MAKVVLITGASSGIGRASADRLHRAGWVVADDDVAAVVHKVLEAKRPPRRVSVGKVSERVGITAKRLLPFRVFEAAAKGSLGVR